MSVLQDVDIAALHEVLHDLEDAGDADCVVESAGGEEADRQACWSDEQEPADEEPLQRPMKKAEKLTRGISCRMRQVHIYKSVAYVVIMHRTSIFVLMMQAQSAGQLSRKREQQEDAGDYVVKKKP